MSSVTPVPDSQTKSDSSGASPAKRSTGSFCRSILESTWGEYMSWNAEYCQNTLDNLCTSTYQRSTIPSVDSTPHYASPVTSNTEVFHITDFDDDSATTNSYSTTASHETICEAVKAYSAYDACTPISRNLMHGDDPDYLPFIPFSDDPQYEFEYDNDHHKFLEWQKVRMDPDSEEIISETLRRLTTDHRLSNRDIDTARILPLPTQDINKLRSKRNFSVWSEKRDSAHSPISEKAEMRPRETVKFFLDRFCNNLNCVTSYCPTHLKTRPRRPPAPKLDPSRIPEVLDKPCGLNCFMQPMSNSDTFSTTWTLEDIELLSVTLDYAPDSLPCDLAVICRKPCREVYRHQKSYKPPNQPAQIEKTRQTTYISSKGLRDYDNLDLKGRRFATRLPCQHIGPCDARSKCACFLTKTPCFSRCGCGKSCPRKWKGCSCAKAAKVCGTKKCSCYKALIECDPEVCLSCEAKDMTSDLCRNVGIQRGTFKDTEVRESEWGLGLFITEPCEKGELISEYVGELIYNPTVRSRAGRSNHIGRSYVFDLNRRVSLDSAYAGNVTRYINHGPGPSSANCDTSVFLVNGEHRIGIFAARQIQPGEELFIDYGPNFFGKAKNAESAS
ncbi:SET domain-containing protein [Pholiota conissans]|uniref:SET domain-containing protein n=1 Tax=Pholiota conissans TaxID=109636 RepID=A0A9P5YTR5_9AGAR|nr:SET domain-containing protein [Pholiota conissans]